MRRKCRETHGGKGKQGKRVGVLQEDQCRRVVAQRTEGVGKGFVGEEREEIKKIENKK